MNLNSSQTQLRVGGLARLSTCDWPGQLVATVFCQGCAWDCAYCHNAHLRPVQSDEQIAWPAVLEFLRKRKGLLDAVVFSGGEPLLQAALPAAVEQVRELGFRVGLHTGGTLPERLATLLPLLDWVGFDVKAPFSVYQRITGVSQSGKAARASLKALLASGVAYEVRTTVHPALLSVDELIGLRGELLALGVTHYAVQQFRAAGTHEDRLPLLPQVSLPNDFGLAFREFTLRG